MGAGEGHPGVVRGRDGVVESGGRDPGVVPGRDGVVGSGRRDRGVVVRGHGVIESGERHQGVVPGREGVVGSCRRDRGVVAGSHGVIESGGRDGGMITHGEGVVGAGGQNGERGREGGRVHVERVGSTGDGKDAGGRGIRAEGGGGVAIKREELDARDTGEGGVIERGDTGESEGVDAATGVESARSEGSDTREADPVSTRPGGDGAGGIEPAQGVGTVAGRDDVAAVLRGDIEGDRGRVTRGDGGTVAREVLVEVDSGRIPSRDRVKLSRSEAIEGECGVISGVDVGTRKSVVASGADADVVPEGDR